MVPAKITRFTSKVRLGGKWLLKKGKEGYLLQLYISDSLTNEQAEEVIREYIHTHRHKMLTILRSQDPELHRKVSKQSSKKQVVALANNMTLVSMLSHTLLYGYGFHPQADVILRSNMKSYEIKSLRVDKDNDGAPLQIFVTIERLAESGAGDFSIDSRTILISELISMVTGDTVSLVEIQIQ